MTAPSSRTRRTRPQSGQVIFASSIGVTRSGRQPPARNGSAGGPARGFAHVTRSRCRWARHCLRERLILDDLPPHDQERTSRRREVSNGASGLANTQREDHQKCAVHTARFAADWFIPCPGSGSGLGAGHASFCFGPCGFQCHSLEAIRGKGRRVVSSTNASPPDEERLARPFGRDTPSTHRGHSLSLRP